jgi:hypothetical protein
MSESPNFVSTKTLGKANKGSLDLGQKGRNTNSWGEAIKTT